MSDHETRKTIGADGLVEFGEYLVSLAQPDYQDYTFEMPGDRDVLSPCSLDDVVYRFNDFCNRRTNTFTVRIGYSDYRNGTIGFTDKTFKRPAQ